MCCCCWLDLGGCNYYFCFNFIPAFAFDLLKEFITGCALVPSSSCCFKRLVVMSIK